MYERVCKSRRRRFVIGRNSQLWLRRGEARKRTREEAGWWVVVVPTFAR